MLYTCTTGILLEGNPLNFANLATNRPGNLARYSSVCENAGHILMTRDSGATAGNPAFLSAAHRTRFRTSNATVTVPCAPLRTLLGDAGVSRLAVLSLDVEGAELSVLQTVDWSALRVDILMVELSGL